MSAPIVHVDTSKSLSPVHSHRFLGAGHEKSERKSWAVIWLCGFMMIAEIVGGLLFGSIALIADGLHMSTRAGALLLCRNGSYGATAPETVGRHERPLWVQDRGRDAHCWTPPARIRTSQFEHPAPTLGV